MKDRSPWRSVVKTAKDSLPAGRLWLRVETKRIVMPKEWLDKQTWPVTSVSNDSGCVHHGIAADDFACASIEHEFTIVRNVILKSRNEAKDLPRDVGPRRQCGMYSARRRQDPRFEISDLRSRDGMQADSPMPWSFCILHYALDVPTESSKHRTQPERLW
jgi:hypothetical protein